MTTAACAPPGAPVSGRCHMAALPIPSGPERHPPRAQRRDPKAHRQTAEIDLESGRSQQGRKQPWLSSSPAIATPRPSWPHGSRKTSLKASPSSPYPSTTANGCARQTRWSGPSSRSSNGAQSRSGYSPAKTRCLRLVQRRPSSRSTKNGPPTQKAYIKWECQDA